MEKAQSSANTTLQVKRAFSAPRDKVFRAWTEPKELARWFAPSADYFTVVPELDLDVVELCRGAVHAMAKISAPKTAS